MVKTRHSGDTDADSPPTFISLANERSRRALKAADPAAAGVDAGGGVGGRQPDRAYRDTPDAYNIFEEKIVESRLRPRIGPSRAYNYIEVDSSDEEIIRRRHRHLPLQEYSPDRRRSRYSRSRQINEEMLDKQERPRRTLRRQASPQEDMEEDQTTEEEDDDSGLRRTRRRRNSLDEDDDEVEEEKTNRSSSSRLHLSADDHEEDTNPGSRSLRRRAPCSQQDEVASSHNLRQRPAAEDDEEHLIRRSSRTRRQVYDTLNQSYLVNIPGRSRHSSGDNNDNSDTKDQDSDENKQFSDMYSRVKRKRVSVKRNMYGVPVMGDSDSEQDAGKSDQNKDDEEEDNCEEDDDEEEAGDSMKNVEDSSNQRITRQRNHSLHKKQPEVVKSYSLREHKPRTDLYKAPIEERRNKRIHSSMFVSAVKKSISQTYHSPAHKRKIRKRSAFHSSSSSTSSDSDEKSFNIRKTKSMDKARSRMMPMNFDSSALRSANTVKDRVKAGASLADIEPMSIDRNITFNSIGGLGKHIRALKEMIVFPLLYDEVFQRFKVDPPRGVLFYGPPGTGKTLVARALANECSKGDRRVAFFMRKGADCLSKWVGESERQLRLLFDQAYRYRPSIIFFDEIDGLAPVRSSRQDQIHSSIVSTLLALMDGLDSRGEIVVIGATNRIDSLDPALRRPGRFDREFLFDLPSLEARKQILKIHTSAWNPKLNDCFISELAEKCVGYCGADLKSLCTEAAMLALRRRYPQIYVSNEALQLDVSSIHVSAKDFFNAVNSIIPTSQRAVHTPAHALPARISPLLHQQLVKVMSQLREIYPYCQTQAAAQDKTGSSQVHDTSEAGVTWDEFASDEDDDAPSIYEKSTSSKGSRKHSSSGGSSEDGPSTTPTYLHFFSSTSSRPATFRPRLLVAGKGGQGQSTYLAPAILHRMEHLRVHVLDLPTLYAVTAKTPEESCTNVFHEAKRKCPSVIYMPYINQWWEVMGETVRATLLTLVQNIDPMLPLLLLATSEQPYHMLDPGLRSLFGQLSDEVVHMTNPSSDERRAFFSDLLLTQAVRPPPQKKQAAQRMLETLPRAAPPKPRELTKDELAQLVEKEELTLMELRIFLRDVLNKLGSDKKFSIFAKPVNIEDAADYYQIIEHPMDLSTMMSKIDLHEYNTVRTFMQDIDLICSNALEYNPNRGPMDRIIRHRACSLKDTAYAIIKTDLDKEFEKTCMEIEESRKLRGERSTTVPNFYYTRPANQQQQQQHAAGSNKNPAAVPSYLDSTKPARSIPKPEGERFSRRVRGLNIDPVPPLEVVEKVYKVSRAGNSSAHEQDDDDGEEEEIETACSNNTAGSSISKEEKMVITPESKVAGVGREKKAASTVGSSKKKKIVKCVWCKPRRKRPRLSTSRPPPTASHASEEEEEMVQEQESKKAAPETQNTESQHLVVDVSEQEVSTSETRDMKSPDRMSTRSRSPAYVGPVSSCSRISTRRSSLSPRGGTQAHIISSDQAETQVEEQTESNRDGAAAAAAAANSGPSSSNNKKDIVGNQGDAPTGSSSQHPGADGHDKPKVVKRLDLESVTLDSGVGSSVDSNGDSHDGMDHKGEGEPGSKATHFSITQECHENSNYSSSRALKDKAGLILNEPHQSMVVDVNQLTSLLNCLVARTDGFCVERLDKIYSQLSHIIYRHRQEYNRSVMISELTQRLDQLVKVASSLNSPSTPSSS